MNTNTTNHDTLRDDLKAYLDNELNWWRRLQVRRHIAGCAECRAEVQDMTHTSKQLQAEGAAAAEETAFDAGLRARILDGAPAADRTFETVAPARRGRPPLKEFALLGGLLSVICFAMLSTVGKKVQTVFNVANNALTTGDGEDYYAPSAGSVPAAAPSASEDRAEAAASKATDSKSSLDDARNALAPAMRQSLRRSTSDAAYVDTTRRVHREASIGVAVKNAEVASDAVVKLVQGAGGYIAGNTLTTGGDDAKNAAMEIRVPVGRFDSVLKQIGELGEVRSKNVSGEDKTEQFSNADQARRILTEDLSQKEAQLRAARQRAERKRKIYVPGWEERQELRNLRIQAAQAKARLEILRKTTDLSDISVTLQEKAPPPGEAGFWQSLNDTKLDAGKAFVGAARIPLACLIWVLAYSPLWLPALLVWKYLNRTPRNAG